MELLVHISAPSSRKDDEKYRRQAEAFSSFEPVKDLMRTREGEQANREQSIISNNEIPPFHDVRLRDTPLASSLPIYLDDTQLAVSALESQILTSSLRKTIARSPAVTTYLDQYTDVSEDTIPAETHMEAITPRRPLARIEDIESGEATTCTSGNSRILDSPQVPILDEANAALGCVGSPKEQQGRNQDQSNHDPTRGSEKKTHSSSWTGDDVPSQLPSSYSLSDVTSGGSRSKMQHSAPSPLLRYSLRPTDSSTVVDQSTNERQGQVFNNPTSPQNPIGTGLPSVEAVVKPAFVPVVKALKRPTEPDPGLLEQLQNLPLSIIPRAPPTTSKSFETHVTSNLRLSIESAALKDRFQPQHKTRQLRISERGHWRIDPSSLPLELQIEFWQFLQRFIGEGKAGWGVSMTRDPEDTQITSQAHSIGLVRIFCWGEVVEHIYLVLYVASRSKIRRLGVTWIDADEEIVVQM